MRAHSPVRVLLLSCFVVAAFSTEWHQPQQTHIAAGNNSDQMIIVWNTLNDTADSTVWYGKGKPSQSANGSSYKFVDQGSEKRVQFVHRVILNDLEPETDYVYMVGSESYGYSDLFRFKTWPSGGDWSPSLLVYGDMGNTNAQSLPRLEMDAALGTYHAVLHVGDFAYNMATDNARVGDEFMRQIEPLASGLPYMTCPGNHEFAYNFSNYRNRFWMPGDENKQMFYSFNMGPIHFVSLSTEHLFFSDVLGLAVKQYTWLDKDLSEASKPENRQKRPWIIVFGHRPMYCSNNDNDDCTHFESYVRVGIPSKKIPGMETLLCKYGVDLAIWAHEHSYERLWPLYDRKVYNGSKSHPYTNPNATVHITTGSAGCHERHDPFTKTEPEWSAFRSEDYGYTRMKVYNSTHLYLEQVSDDKNGAIIDKVMLIKDKHGPYASDPKPVTPYTPQVKVTGLDTGSGGSWRQFRDNALRWL